MSLSHPVIVDRARAVGTADYRKNRRRIGAPAADISTGEMRPATRPVQSQAVALCLRLHRAGIVRGDENPPNVALGDAPMTLTVTPIAILEIGDEMRQRISHRNRAIESEGHAHTRARGIGIVLDIQPEAAIEVAGRSNACATTTLE